MKDAAGNYLFTYEGNNYKIMNNKKSFFTV